MPITHSRCLRFEINQIPRGKPVELKLHSQDAPRLPKPLIHRLPLVEPRRQAGHALALRDVQSHRPRMSDRASSYPVRSQVAKAALKICKNGLQMT